MSDFGTQLKQARENRGISLRQIATSTKISVVALEALERGDFSRLPGGIFSRAFVRSYALEVGLNPEEVVAQFLVELGAATPAEDDTPRPDVTDDDRAFLERQRKAGLALRIGLAVLALLIIASVVAWQMTRGGEPARTPATDNFAFPAPAAAPPVVPARLLARGERQTLEAQRQVVLSLGRVGEVRSVTICSANATEFLQTPDALPTQTASATTRP